MPGNPFRSLTQGRLTWPAWAGRHAQIQKAGRMPQSGHDG